MQKNAREYTQEATTGLKQAIENLQSALETVEKPHNHEQIEQALQACQTAYNQTTQTANILGQE
ncbi:hypothetical protein [Gottfriedia luciferensis]|uniref:hypothetical protein n=1 Tax=Gottfriedia luciferensis TaxID=178774 RepID=UPI000B433948|nr:hypothetical protein [Gottfriedia luciferensis]